MFFAFRTVDHLFVVVAFVVVVGINVVAAAAFFGRKNAGQGRFLFLYCDILNKIKIPVFFSKQKQKHILRLLNFYLKF